MNIIECEGGQTLQKLIPRFLQDADARLVADTDEGWVVEISHHVQVATGETEPGDWVTVLFAINLGDKTPLSEDDSLLDGLLLQSHITSLDNILHSLKLDLQVAGWEIAIFEQENQ